MKKKIRRRIAALAVCAALCAVWTSFAAAQQLSPEESALQVLNSARRAYNEQQYPVAADRFREFLRLAPGHREAVAAQYGLGLSILASPEKDPSPELQPMAAALQALQAASGADFPDRPYAMYYLGVVTRMQAEYYLAQAIARPDNAPSFRANAADRFATASQQFAKAAELFAARVKQPLPPDAKELPAELEWTVKAKCDQADSLLRAGKYKEAADIASAIVADANMAKSRYRALAFYYVGYAAFAQKDYASAGRALAQLAPFNQDFGVHARYLLARTHQALEQRPEAAAQYRSVVSGWDEQKKQIESALKDPNYLKDKPVERAAQDALVKGPPPEYVGRSQFYLGVLLSEDGKHQDALDRFTALVQLYPKSPLAVEAVLRQGISMVQLRKFPEAIQTLAALREHPQVSDQAWWWTGRAQVGAADPANLQAYTQALMTGIESMRQAAERSRQSAKADPDARQRRADILMDLGDHLQYAKQYKEAIATYQLLQTETTDGPRAEEAMQRLATAYHLSAQYAQSDEICQRFEKTYPRSTLMAAVLFREGENAFMQSTAARPSGAPITAEEAKPLLLESIKRYKRLIEKYPEFTYTSLARHGMGLAYYRLGQYDKAAESLAGIPDTDRQNEMATVSYMIGDAMMRTLPENPQDALQAARLMDQAGESVRMLDAFVSGQSKSPMAPAAMLKLGHVYQRVGSLIIEPTEKKKALMLARETYDKLLQGFPNDPVMPTAVFERANVQALMGDGDGTAAMLNRFLAEPLRSSNIAPMAIMRLAAIMRAQNRAAEAAKILGKCRDDFEAALAKDPARADWIPSLQYEHALALKESGKPAEAKALFEQCAKQFANRPEGQNANWRAGQCRREEVVAAVNELVKQSRKPGITPEELSALKTALPKAIENVRQTADFFIAQADTLAKAGNVEGQVQLIYEAAWAYRALADGEVEVARQQMSKEALRALKEKLVREFGAAGAAGNVVRAPDVPLTAVPLQPSEQKTRELYQQVNKLSPDSSLAMSARLEMAELHSQRAEYDAAIGLLADSLEKDPLPLLAERIKLRLGTCLLAKGDNKAALPLIESVAKNVTSPVGAEARYLAAECALQRKDWPKAIELLVPFRDTEPLRSLQGVADRALIRLGQVYAEAGQMPNARQTYLVMIQKFPNSPWIDEARYGVGYALQQQQSWEAAISAYQEVTRSTGTEVAAKAQLQTGICRLSMKRYPEAIKALLVVPFTYDYPECCAAAWCEAGRAYAENNQKPEATKALQRVLKDYPSTKWAEIAKQRLDQLGK